MGSATLVAVTLTIAEEGTLAGATYSPLFEIVPHAAPAQAAPLTFQVTAEFEEPVTFPINCWLFPTVTIALFGSTVIATGVALTMRVAALLVALPPELLTIMLNWLRLSEIITAGIVKVAEVALVIPVPFFCH